MLLALFLSIVIQWGSGWHDVIAALLEALSGSCATTVDCVSSSSDSWCERTSVDSCAKLRANVTTCDSRR